MIHDPLTPDVGVSRIDDVTALWRVWASKARRVELILDPLGRSESIELAHEGHGYFSGTTTLPEAGTRYGYSLDGNPPLAAPCSRWQPDGVDAPSAVYFADRFDWDEGDWKGIDRGDLVFYELHVGTFTPEGTFDAIIPRIDALREVGVTAIELMPVAQFAGARSWGYDGVHPFAVQNSYGGPESLQRLVAACHRKGMAVVLDVVYNHFGPEGLVLTTFGEYLTEKTRTDWGPAVNFDARDCDPVRSMVLQNVQMWVRDFRFDGLRFDAADQIYDRSCRHILSEVSEAAHEASDRLGRHVHVFAETDLNDARRFLNPRERGGYGFDGHWNDDFHHALHVVLTGETNGYYQDFADGPAALAKVLAEGFVNNGNYSEFRGRRHGTSATEFPGDRLVAFSQNHDQVGNRLKADRYAASIPAEALRLAAGVVLLAPRLPLLFMGEEYGETNPFPFFCDYRKPELIEAVRKGRQAEFAYFGWDEGAPDPFSKETRDSAVLSWTWDDPSRAALRALYRDLLRIRREWPGFRDFSHAMTRLVGPSTLEMIRGSGSPEPLTVLFNLGGAEATLPEDYTGRRPAFRSVGADDEGPPLALRPYEFMIFGRSVAA